MSQENVGVVRALYEIWERAERRGGCDRLWTTSSS